MRVLILFLSIAACSLSACSSPQTTAQFYQAHKRKAGVTNFKIPGWLVWFGGGIAYNSIKDEEAKTSLKLARKVKKMRLMVAEDGSPISPEETQAFIGNIRQAGYDDLLFVKDGPTTVNILIREKKDKLKNIVLLVNDEGEFVYMDIKSNIRYQDISSLINQLMKDTGVNMEEPVDEKPPKEEKEKPRA